MQCKEFSVICKKTYYQLTTYTVFLTVAHRFPNGRHRFPNNHYIYTMYYNIHNGARGKKTAAAPGESLNKSIFRSLLRS
jgi:hypothetical protein